MLRTLIRPVTFGALALLLLSCGGSHGGGAEECGVEAQKQFVLDVVDDWYLFQEDLPSSVNIDNFATADDLLEFLTQNARNEGKDRHFSFLTTKQEDQSFFGEGQTIAFGFVTQLRQDPDQQHWHLFVAKVEPGSPADAAGFDRGDEILAIGPDAQHLTPISSFTGDFNEVQAEISQLFGPFEEGVTRVFRVDPIGGGDPATRTATKEVITLEPVPIVKTFPRSGTTPVGYLAFDTFIDPADPELRQAFTGFKDQQVHDVIVDLRYNGGGLIRVAQTLADLLADQEAGNVMFTYTFNNNHPEENHSELFAHEPEGISSFNIAFITTGGTASASELVINSLEPYVNVAIIGSKTFGKPVGQGGFEMPDCDTELRLIAFKTVNADGEGDYFGGLPDDGPGEPHNFSGDFCNVDDDLFHERGDSSETSTDAALTWIDEGHCPGAGKALSPLAKALAPRLDRPSLAQDSLPGLF